MVACGDYQCSKELIAPDQLRLGEHQCRLFDSALRGHAGERRVGRCERGVRQSRVNFREQLALFHVVAALDLQ
jgi:hypothetical protein